MSQIIQVLKCYKCNVFQVQIKKKSNRWICKLCEEKQSLIKIYGEGSGKDCRLHCQKLNKMRGMQEEVKNEATCDFQDSSHESNWKNNYEEDMQPRVSDGRKKSKWDSYLEDDMEETSDDRKGSEIKMKDASYESHVRVLDHERPPFSTSSFKTKNTIPHIDDRYSRKQPPLSSAVFITGLNGNMESRVNNFMTSEEIHTTDSSSRSGNSFKAGSCQTSNEMKSLKLFCATKNDELDEILQL